MSATPLTVKLGGAAGAHAASLSVLVERAEPGWAIVHGGGSEIKAWSDRLGMASEFVDGLRVTDAATLDVAIGVLRGIVNARLVAAFAAGGVPAIGLGGADGDLLRAERFDDRLGHVGRVRHVNGELLASLASDGYVPVIAPIARGAGIELLNVNADEAAGAVAAARGGRLLLLTDVPAVLQDGDPLAIVDAASVERMLADDTATGGMRPKLRAALEAARAGCDVQIVNGTDPGAVRAALDGEVIGTTVTASPMAGIG